MASRSLRVESPPERPLVVFDGDCGFCRYWILRWRERTGDALEYTPYQDPAVARRFPALTPERCARALQIVETDGGVSEGAEAVCRTLARSGIRWPLALYRRLPGAAAVAEWGYRLVARHRLLASRLTGRMTGQGGSGPVCSRDGL
jgi:predicted DCC family thiol-disulfide oxidoreductase YuxK